MANAAIEKTLKKIADTQLVHARLMETNERKWNKRFEGLRGRTEKLEQASGKLLRATEKLWHIADAHEQRSEKLWRVAEAHEQRVESLEDAVRTMLASMDRLIKAIEDFAKGRKRENGRP